MTIESLLAARLHRPGRDLEKSRRTPCGVCSNVNIEVIVNNEGEAAEGSITEEQPEGFEDESLCKEFHRRGTKGGDSSL